MKKNWALIGMILFISQSLFAQVQEFAWLIGTWKEKSAVSYEEWKLMGNLLQATSYQQDAAGKKKITEEIKLIKKDGKFFYVPDVEGEQGPIYFEITHFDKNSFVAENAAHDFPKKITYKKTEDQLQASIQDDTMALMFNFQKVK
ncbi:MAG: DUF6265 family protein [Cyclobacteriaceae bacterium]